MSDVNITDLLEKFQKSQADFLDAWKQINHYWHQLSENQQQQINNAYNDLLYSSKIDASFHWAMAFVKSVKNSMDDMGNAFDKLQKDSGLVVPKKVGRTQKPLYNTDGEIVTDDHLVRMYNDEGKSLEEIAKYCQCSRGTIRLRLEQIGVTLELPNGFQVVTCAKCGRAVRIGNLSCLTEYYCSTCEPPRDPSMNCNTESEKLSPSDISFKCSQCGGVMRSSDKHFGKRNRFVCQQCNFVEMS